MLLLLKHGGLGGTVRVGESGISLGVTKPLVMRLKNKNKKHTHKR